MLVSMLSIRSRISSAVRTGVFPRLHRVFGAADRCRRIGGNNLADYEPVEEHTDGGQVLLHGRPGSLAAEFLQPGCDVNGLNGGQIRELPPQTPGGEPACGAEIRTARVVVRDMGGEELPKSPRRTAIGQK